MRGAGHADLHTLLGTAVVARVGTMVVARVNTENWKMLKTWIMFRRTLVLMTTQTGILSMSGMVTVGSLVLNMGRLMMNMDIQMLTIGAWMLTVDNLMTVSSLMWTMSRLM